MEEIDILEDLFDSKILKILRQFIKDPEAQYYLRELSKSTDVPVTSTLRIIKKLEEKNVIKITKIKKLKLYSLQENKTTAFLTKILKKDERIIDVFISRISVYPGLETVILHGSEKDKKTNLLLIGSNIDANEVKTLCGEIREKYNYTITSLTLTREQFEQMSAMGLYPGKKKIVWKR